ncbi:PanE/ApbA-like ketopantoate reductase [Aureococcus anophagefferens]|nr:PanE/ApbA-like ketopantoate reductase [Aureococcus anophagefferens]
MLASRLSRQLLSRVSARRLSGEAMQLKVGIVGAGAVGTYFGVRLAELGHDVRFLLNPGEAPPKALTVNSWQGDFELDAPTYASSPGELGGGRARRLGARGPQVDGARRRRRGPDGEARRPRRDGTRVQLLMNGLGAEELAADALGRVENPRRASSYGGSAGRRRTPCSTRAWPRSCGAAPSSTTRRRSPPRSGSGAQRRAAPPARSRTPQPCLRLAQWSKLAWNIPFNGATVCSNSNGDALAERRRQGAAIGPCARVIRRERGSGARWR